MRDDVALRGELDDLDLSLVDRMLSGEATVDDRDRFNAWAVRHVSEHDFSTLVTDASRANANATVMAPDHTDGWAAIERQLRHPSSRQPRRTLAIRSAVAGALMVTTILVAMVFVPSFRRIAHPPDARQHYRTAPGQRSSVQLANGAVLMLAPSTSVTVSPNLVHVIGEVYFKIAPRASRPFVVQTRNTVVQVLGTTFSVRQYPTERASRVVVEDGRVTVRAFHGDHAGHHAGNSESRADDQPTVVAERMVAVVTDSGIAVTRGVDTRELTGWTQGMLVFHNVPLRDAINELARAYGVNIRVEDTLLAREPMTMDVAVDRQSIARILDLISVATDAHYTNDGQTYLLSPGRPSTRTPHRLNLPQPEQQYGR